MIMHACVMSPWPLYSLCGVCPIPSIHCIDVITLPFMRNARVFCCNLLSADGPAISCRIPLSIYDDALAIIDVGFWIIDSARPFLAAMRALPGEFGTRRELPRDVRGGDCTARGYWPF